MAIKIAYYYDKNANVSCNDKDIHSSYDRKEDINIVIDSYKKDNYKCFIYGNDLEEHKNIIVGSWCGYRYDDTNLKYTFNNNGTIEMTTLGTNYNGYYGVENNNISYGVFLTSNNYDIILQENYFYYDENTDTINLTNKMIDDKYNIFNRCN